MQALHQTSRAFRAATSRLPDATWAEIAQRTLPYGHPVRKAPDVRTAAKRFWADCAGLRQRTAACQRVRKPGTCSRLSFDDALERVLLLQVRAGPKLAPVPSHSKLNSAFEACCCAQPDYRHVLVLAQPDTLWLCKGSRCLGRKASKVYDRTLPCRCRFAHADSSPDGQLALLKRPRCAPSGLDLLLWDVTAGVLVGRREFFQIAGAGYQWLPAGGNTHMLCCTMTAPGVRFPAQVWMLDATLGTLATSDVYEQRQEDSCFRASPCGSWLCGIDGTWPSERLIILDASSCAAVAEIVLACVPGFKRLLWTPCSGGVLVVDKSRPTGAASGIFWVRSACWQALSCEMFHGSPDKLYAWTAQGLLCTALQPVRTTELRCVPAALLIAGQIDARQLTMTHPIEGPPMAAEHFHNHHCNWAQWWPAARATHGWQLQQTVCSPETEQRSWSQSFGCRHGAQCSSGGCVQ